MLVIISIKGHGIRFNCTGACKKSLLDTFRCNLTRSLIWLSSQRVLVPCSGLGQGHPHGRHGHCRVPSGAAAPPRASYPHPRRRAAVPLSFGVAPARGCGLGRSGAGGGGARRAEGVACHGGRGLSLWAFWAADARSWRVASWQSREHSAGRLHALWCVLRPRVPAALKPNPRPCISTGQGR